MTNVEALLSVEAGRVPEGVMVFVERDLDAGRAKAWRVVGILMAAATFLTALNTPRGDAGMLEVGLMAVFAAFALLMAAPTQEDRMRAQYRRVLVVSESGFITRDRAGLRNWHYDEVARISRCIFEGQSHLLIEDQNGKEHLLDHTSFENAEQLFEALRANTERGDAIIA